MWQEEYSHPILHTPHFQHTLAISEPYSPFGTYYFSLLDVPTKLHSIINQIIDSYKSYSPYQAIQDRDPSPLLTNLGSFNIEPHSP